MDMVAWLLRLDLWGFQVVTMLLSILWQSSIVIAVAGILSYMLRKSKASVRHTLWAVSVLSVPLIPFLGWVADMAGTPRTPIPFIPVQETRIPPDFAGSPVRDSGDGILPGSMSLRADEATVFATPEPEKMRLPFSTVSPWTVLLTVYCFGMGMFCLFLIFGRARIVHMISGGKTVADPDILAAFERARLRLGLRRRISVVETGAVEVPLASGVIHPVVFLPERFGDMFQRTEMYALALHELSHIRRWDPFVLTLVSFVRAVFFFHPLLWVAIHQMAKYAELACDDAVVEHSGEPVGYARMLARVAERIATRNARVQLASGFLFSRSTLFTRVEAILADRRETRRLSRFAIIIVSILGAGTVWAAVHFPLDSFDRGKQVEVAGVVLSGDGPVRGAVVYLVTLDRGSGSIMVKKTARSDARGAFQFRTAQGNTGVNRARSMILVRHPDYAMGWVTIGDAPEMRKRAVYLGRPCSVSGVVKDRTGRPVKGARVGLLTIFPRESFGFVSEIIFLAGKLEHAWKLTDSKGRFRLGNIPESANISLIVDSKGYVRNYQKAISVGEPEVICVLSPGGRISGKVVYGGTGDPAPDINVIVRSAGYRIKEEVRTTTRRDGSYVIEGLSEGQYHVFVGQSDIWTAKVRRNVAVRPEETISGINFSLSRGGFVTGRVFDRQTGLPVSRCPLAFSEACAPSETSMFHFIYTDAEGRYGFRATSGRAVVRLVSGLPDGYRAYGDDAREIPVEEGAVLTGIDFALVKGAVVTGVVRTKNGDPLPGARVSMEKSLTVAYADQQGRFLFSGLAHGDSLTLRATGKDSLYVGVVRAVAGSGVGTTITVEQRDAVTVTGRVVDTRGNSLPGTPVMLMNWEKGANYGTSALAATSGLDGRFTIRNLREGETYNVYPEDGSPDQHSDFTARHGLPPIVLVQPDAAGWLEGTITDEAGAPLPGVMVYLNKPETGVRISHTDHLGRYRLERIMGKRADLIINHRTYGSYTHRRLELNRRYDFQLTRAGQAASGMVLDSDGKPVADAWVMPEEIFDISDGFSPNSTRTDKDGRFTLTGLRKFRIRVSVQHRNFPERTFELDPGGGPVTLVLSGGKS